MNRNGTFQELERTTPHDHKTNTTCPQCGYKWWDKWQSRKTNDGNAKARELAYFLNTQTPYEATLEPKSTQKRKSGVGVRPDIKVRLRDGRGVGFIFIERQHQNTTGTGAEKIANKIHKANTALRDLNVIKYYIVIAGKRVDLLLKVAQDTFDNGAYRHERLVIIEESAFKLLAVDGRL